MFFYHSSFEEIEKVPSYNYLLNLSHDLVKRGSLWIALMTTFMTTFFMITTLAHTFLQMQLPFQATTSI